MKKFSLVLVVLVLAVLSLTASAQDSATLTVLVEQGGVWLQEAGRQAI